MPGNMEMKGGELGDGGGISKTVSPMSHARCFAMRLCHTCCPCLGCCDWAPFLRGANLGTLLKRQSSSWTIVPSRVQWVDPPCDISFSSASTSSGIPSTVGLLALRPTRTKHKRFACAMLSRTTSCGWVRWVPGSLGVGWVGGGLGRTVGAWRVGEVGRRVPRGPHVFQVGRLAGG